MLLCCCYVWWWVLSQKKSNTKDCSNSTNNTNPTTKNINSRKRNQIIILKTNAAEIANAACKSKTWEHFWESYTLFIVSGKTIFKESIQKCTQKTRMSMIFMNSENSKTSDAYRLKLNVLGKIGLLRRDDLMALLDLSISGCPGLLKVLKSPKKSKLFWKILKKLESFRISFTHLLNL